MTLTQLKTACEGFRTLLRKATGRDLIDSVSVDEPKEPEDELHFQTCILVLRVCLRG